MIIWLSHYASVVQLTQNVIFRNQNETFFLNQENHLRISSLELSDFNIVVIKHVKTNVNKVGE